MRAASGKRPVRRTVRSHRAIVWMLVFCFPIGLFMMWSDRCRWSRTVKSAVSLAVAAGLIAIVLPQTLPPERVQGGVVLVGSKPQVDVFGPEAPEAQPTIEIYSPRYTQLLAEPTPTPVPVYVYCNTGGKYYHSAECKYVKANSTKVTLSQAVAAGYVRCPECSAPPEYEAS